MAVNENGVFVVETADELKAWMKDFHANCDESASGEVYAMLQFVEGWLDGQWRPIETHPRKYGMCLLCTASGHVQEGTWCEQFQRFDDGGEGFEIENVTHWMPLPAPPQEPVHA